MARLEVSPVRLSWGEDDFGCGEATRCCATRARTPRDLPQALAAIDLALWDRAGRRTGRPVAHLLAAA